MQNSNGNQDMRGWPVPPNPHESPPGQGLGIASMVLGIISLIIIVIPFLNFFIAVIGVVLAVISNKQNAMAGYPRSGMAVAGLVMSLITLGISSLVFLSCVCFSMIRVPFVHF